MKKSNKIITVLGSIVCGIILCLGIFLAIDYFSSSKTAVKKTEQTTEEKEETKTNKNTVSDEEKYRNTDSSEEKEKNTKTTVTKSTAENKTSTVNKKEEKTTDTSSTVTLMPRSYTYNGKKLSPIAGIGNTGKVFSSQSEALKYGQDEVTKLTAQDKKHRQFGVGRVIYEDGSLAGWTVEIYENTN